MSARFVLSAAAAYSLIGIVERGLALLTMPITTRIFTSDDVAQLVAIANVTTLLAHIGAMLFMRGLAPALARQPDDTARRQLSSSVFWATIVAGLATVTAAGFMASPIATLLKQPPEFVPLLHLGLAAMLSVTVGVTLMVLARSIESHRLAVTVQALALVVQASLLLGLLLIARWGVSSVLWASFAAALLAIACYAAALGPTWLTAAPSGPRLREALVLSLHLAALQLAPLVMLNCSGIILNALGRPEEAAYLSIAAGAAGVALLSAASFEGVWTAYVLRRRGDPELPGLALRIFDAHSAAFLVAGAAGSLFAHEVFAVLVGPRFVEAYRYVPPLIGCYALLSLAQGFGQGIQMGDRPWRFAWIGLATAAVYLALGIPAAHAFGAPGLLAAMALALVLMIILTQHHSAAELPIAYPWARHAVWWVLACAVTAVGAYLPLGWMSAAIKLVILLAVAVAALAAARLSLREAVALVQSLVGRSALGG